MSKHLAAEQANFVSDTSFQLMKALGECHQKHPSRNTVQFIYAISDVRGDALHGSIDEDHIQKIRDMMVSNDWTCKSCTCGGKTCQRMLDKLFEATGLSL